MIYQGFNDASLMFSERNIAAFNVENRKNMEGTLM